MQTGMTFLLLANMKEKNYTGIIPEQQTGKAIDSETSLELDNVEEAKAFFNVVKTRLQDINNWHELAGSFSADFQLVNKDGLEVQRRAEKVTSLKLIFPVRAQKAAMVMTGCRLKRLKVQPPQRLKVMVCV